MSDAIAKKAKHLLDGLTGPVKLVFFTQEMECPHCRDARSVVEAVAGLSDKVAAGYEYTTLLEAMKIAAQGKSMLSRPTLAALQDPVELMVFVTLTCACCPMAAAVASNKISVSVFGAGEFPRLATLYEVMAVPKTVVNRTGSIDGAPSEAELIDEIEKSLAPAAEPEKKRK